MRKNRKVLLIFVLMIALMTGMLSVSAEAAELAVGSENMVESPETTVGSETTVGTTETTVESETTVRPTTGTDSQSKPRAGWNKVGNYKVYYNANGRLITGWKKINGKIYYFRKKAKGDAPVGSRLTGFQVIGKRTFYFNEIGVLQTGWQTIEGKRYYFRTDGEYGNRGTMYTGLKKIEEKKYYFTARGFMKTGWITYNEKTYYFSKSKKVSERGTAYTGWQTIGEDRYYFTQNGVLKKNCWISNKYYVDSEGRMMKNDVTPDGYHVDANGVKGKLATSISILIIAGHGQGDSGATATYGSTVYREDQYTRQFATLIYNDLREINPDLNVVMYDQKYDCYQVVAGRKSGPAPNFKQYDYVLEIHFNATGTASKDLSGDGNYKGVGMYVNSAKRDTTIDKKIVAALSAAANFPIWGRDTGIFTSSGLLNAKTCQGQGVSYGLLETAFIDDKDDMILYNSKKNEMAKAVATAINSYFMNAQTN